MKTSPALCRSLWLASATAAWLASAGGCSSVIGSAYLREAWLDAVEHAAESKAAARLGNDSAEQAVGTEDEGDGAATRDGEAAVDQSVGDAAAESAARNRYATLDEAVADADRALARSGGLSDAARDTLSAMLHTMPRQDWPVVVDEFTASLAAAAPPPRAAPAASAPEEEQRLEPAGVSDAPMPPLPPSQPAAPATATPAAAPPVASRAEAGAAVPEQPGPKPAPGTPDSGSQTPVTQAPGTKAPEMLTVQNACFATRVRAWGAVDRFEHSRFVPGQEVIVYFELDHLATQESTDGHTTRVDSRLKLVGADGRRVHEWTFEPLEETCRSRRRDYFVRYVLTIPESTPAGPCRLEISVTDAIGGRTAQSALPLEVQVR